VAESATKSRVNTRAGESSAGIMAPFSVYDGLLAPERPSTSDGKRVRSPRCLDSSWSSEIVLRVCAEAVIGAAERRLDSARWPPDTPGCDVPEITVNRSRRSSSGAR
jgi:hypothetical protein